LEGLLILNSYRLRSKRKRKREETNFRRIKIKEKFYKRNFYFFEIGFIAIALPVLIIALTSIPILIFFTITQYFQLWPFIILGALIAFFQIIAIQFFVKKYYLNPYNMTFGEYLRFRFDERNVTDVVENKPKKTWYDNLDEFIIQIRNTQREQTLRIYAANHEKAILPQ
jgi:hypothetical protein